MLSFIARRLGLLIPTFFGITLLTFALIRLIPGDPVEVMMGERRVDPNLDGAGRRALASAFYLSRKHRDAEVHACPLPNSLGEMQRLPEVFREVLAGGTWA